MNPKSNGFYGLGIAPNIIAVIEKFKLHEPTPIQAQSIPQAIEGKDLIGVAQTGTGKTLAFGIPLLQATLSNKKALVILPTRELAYQVHDVFKNFGTPLNVRSAVLVGGESIGRQIQALHRSPQIIIGTPGRIIDHLQQKTLVLKNISILVLDEADRMLDMGFAPQLKRILVSLPHERQTLLFSATMPPEIVNIAKQYMKLPTRVEIAPPGTTVDRVTQELFFLQKHDKPRLLEKVLGEYRGSILVFTRTKFGAKKLTMRIRSLGYTSAEIHSNRSMGQRKDALEGFKDGRYKILVATDIAARGIDVSGIELVLNYDLPQSSDDYVHRIGRTARAGGKGHAISFATPDQKHEVRNIERLIRSVLPLSKLPELPPARAEVSERFATPFRSRYERPKSNAHGYQKRFSPRQNFRRR
mgnify:CR=1 FL=1